MRLLFHQLFFILFYLKKKKKVRCEFCYLFLFLDRDEVVCCWRPFDWKRTLVFYDNFQPFLLIMLSTLSREKRREKKTVNGTYIYNTDGKHVHTAGEEKKKKKYNVH